MTDRCGCATESQIVWFFEKPTVLVCWFCERTANYYEETKCRFCGRDMVRFTALQAELDTSLESVAI